MKKILLATVAALAITSCSQNEEFDNAGQKAEINFSTIVSKATRASELTTDGLKTNGGFKVFAYNTGTENMATTTVLSATPFMDGVAVTWSEKWVMNPAGPYYWPLLDKKIQFFSYSPVTNNVLYAEPNGTDAGYPSFTYTIPSSQEDLVVAHAKNQTKPTTSGTPVILNFKHVLAQINFKLKAKDSGFTYTVTKISLSKINNKGTFTYGDPDVKVGDWTSTSGAEAYDYVATYSSLTSASELDLKTDNNGLMLMPQALGDDAKITITYSTVYDTTAETVFNATKEVSLKDVTWHAGDKILYTLTLPSGAEEVTLTPEVGSWNTETTPEANEAQ